jgi:hypothetical protein
MFNLDQAVLEWRRQMLAADIKSPVPLDELETHLRDEIEQQTKSGVSEAEAFQTAVEKIGRAHMIQNEFKKVEPKWEGLEWKLKEIVLAVFSILFPLMMSSSVLSNRGSAAEMTPGQKISCLAAFAMFVLLVWGGRLGYRIFPVVRSRRIRNAIGLGSFALVGLWGLVLLRFVLPRHDCTMSQVTLAFIWGWIVPMGAHAGLFWGIETAARKKVAAQ